MYKIAVRAELRMQDIGNPWLQRMVPAGYRGHRNGNRKEVKRYE